ncbi:adenosylcobinamide-GDP ribazoletransferase [uncultured Desulfovibrio sp.]|uniref:adenosylcobinamide-GDP ribazoletransferase n=1 Tax=uncultured Desulfovibrio sp. TaxID=167968 RepID=UPI0025F6CA9D|nr:adenosylcobinamide-GDP ribazoletransferase [uncultured Desulfovibrio sp.]
MMLRAALAFFTRLPVGSPPPGTGFRGIMAWLPTVGMLIGLLAACALWAAMQLLPPVLCGLVGCLVWVGITGGLHLDGVADCGDGLLVEAPPARRLEIMKDSRLGTFGALALFFVLGGKAAALGVLADTPAPGQASFWALAGMCCMAAVTARSLVFVALLLPCARPGGLGSAMNDGVTASSRLAALLLTLFFCLCTGWRGLAALLTALAAAALLLSAALRRLGGVTGDVFGCLIEVTESCMLLVFCLPQGEA